MKLMRRIAAAKPKKSPQSFTRARDNIQRNPLAATSNDNLRLLVNFQGLNGVGVVVDVIDFLSGKPTMMSPARAWIWRPALGASFSRFIEETGQWIFHV